jgi:hypothetical protein
VNAFVTGLDVECKVLADEAIEQRSQDVLLKIPSVDGTAYIVGDVPDFALQCGTLLGSGQYCSFVMRPARREL